MTEKSDDDTARESTCTCGTDCRCGCQRGQACRCGHAREGKR